MNSSIILLVALLLTSCGVKSPPTATGDMLPSIDSIYMKKVINKEVKKEKEKEKKI